MYLEGKIKNIIRMNESESSDMLQKIHFCYAFYKKSANPLLLKINIFLYNRVSRKSTEKFSK